MSNASLIHIQHDSVQYLAFEIFPELSASQSHELDIPDCDLQAEMSEYLVRLTMRTYIVRYSMYQLRCEDEDGGHVGRLNECLMLWLKITELSGDLATNSIGYI